jgi:predicted Zn-dependent peptidase
MMGRHYYASNMALAVVGTQELDTLEGWVRAKFSDIADRRPDPDISEEPAAPSFPVDEHGLRFHSPFPPRVAQARAASLFVEATGGIGRAPWGSKLQTCSD